MKVGVLATMVFAISIGYPIASFAGLAPDADGDGIPDVLDKCTLDSRNATAPATCDTDVDGYGNTCDGDFDQTLHDRPRPTSACSSSRASRRASIRRRGRRAWTWTAAAR